MAAFVFVDAYNKIVELIGKMAEAAEPPYPPRFVEDEDDYVVAIACAALAGRIINCGYVDERRKDATEHVIEVLRYTAQKGHRAIQKKHFLLPSGSA
jgi:hypothetical protein